MSPVMSTAMNSDSQPSRAATGTIPSTAAAVRHPCVDC